MKSGHTLTRMAPGLRWAFRFSSWVPSEVEWSRAARCVQPEEKDRIGRFVFRKDAKSAMAGRLLIRKAISQEIGVPYKDIDLKRTEKGKPYLANSLPEEKELFNFNVSHQGDFAVLAAEHCHLVGVDVMKVEHPRGTTLQEFFSRMSRQFTMQEWKFIRQLPSDQEQIARFYRVWCLKESYVKALGVGIGFELQRLDFHVGTAHLAPGGLVRDTHLLVDGQRQMDWTFEETSLDGEHFVAVALQRRVRPDKDEADNFEYPQPFTVLPFSELIEGAVPQQEQDDEYWENFDAKMERPGG